jgi:hypothetical protein
MVFRRSGVEPKSIINIGPFAVCQFNPLRVHVAVRIWYTPDFYLTGLGENDDSTVFSSANRGVTIGGWHEFYGFNGLDHWDLLSLDLSADEEKAEKS